MNKKGFTLVEIMIVVAIIGILAAIAIPNFIRARIQATTKACVNNLKQIDGAKQQYALENKKDGTFSPTAAQLAPYMRDTVNAFACPANATAYSINSVAGPVECANQDDADPEFSGHQYP